MQSSKAEAQLELHLKAAGIEYEREYRFHPTRRWRFDFALLNEKQNIAVEVEGIKYSGKSRHQTGVGFQGDLDKYDEAMRLGWIVYRCSPAMVKSGRALQTIEVLTALREHTRG